jgi:hypothetical protein
MNVFLEVATRLGGADGGEIVRRGFEKFGNIVFDLPAQAGFLRASRRSVFSMWVNPPPSGHFTTSSFTIAGLANRGMSRACRTAPFQRLF